MIKRYLSIFIFSMLIFPPMILAKESISLSLSQTTLDLNSSNITDIKPNEKFIYQFDISNDSKIPVKGLTLSDDFPQELSIVKIIDSKDRWNCKNIKKNSLTCKLKSVIKPEKSEVLKVLVVANSKDSDEIINSAFINDYDSDTSTINIINKKNSTEKNSDVRFSCKVSDNQPKVGDLVSFIISTSKDDRVLVKLDDNLEFIQNDRCKHHKSDLICDIGKNEDLNISAKALSYGYTISDFSTIDTNILKSVPLQIDRDFIPDLKLDIKSDREKVVSDDIYTYSIDINGSKLKDDVKELDLLIKTISEVNFKYVKTLTDGFECEQNNYNLDCSIEKLDKNSTTKLMIEVKAPTTKTAISISAILLPNNKDINPVINDVQIVEFDYSGDKSIDFVKSIDIKTDGKMINIGDKNLQSDNSYLPNSKLFQSHKKSSIAKLSIGDDENVTFAKLYWMGKIDKNIDIKKIKRAKNIKFKNQKDKEFHLYESDLDRFGWRNDGDFFIYGGEVDLTEYIKKSRSGIYEVKELMTSEGFGGDASWNLLVVTKSNSSKNEMKKIVVYDGFLGLWDSKGFMESKDFKNAINLKFNDFKTSEDKKPDARLAIYSLCGDSGYLDRLSIRDKDGVSHEKIDILENSQSVDIDISYAFMKNQTSTDINISSSGDKVYIKNVALEVKVEK